MVQSNMIQCHAWGVIILDKKTEKINVRIDKELNDQLNYIKEELSKRHLIKISESEVVRTAIRYLADELKK